MNKDRRTGAVSGGNKDVVDTACDVLSGGGNAVDAAIAAYLVACVAEPCMASLAGGMFCLYWPAQGAPLALDAFCQTPEHKKPAADVEFLPILVDFGTEQELFYAGMGSVAVPAVVSGLFELHEKLGTIPMSELAQPAIEGAREGIPLSNFQHHDLELLDKIYHADPSLSGQFFQDSELVSPGTLVKNSEFADYLYYLSRAKARDFYYGDFGLRLLALSEQHGGHLSTDDLRDVHTIWEPANRTVYRNAEIYSPASGSFGGWLLRYWFDTLAIGDARSYRSSLADALWATAGVARSGMEQFRNLRQNGTSHFNVLDRWGNGVAMTFSIGEGAGRVVPGTGVHLNNMLGEAALLPEGFHSWKENDRMVSMMAPVGLWHPERNTRMLLGSGGAGRIPFMLAQVIQDWLEGDRHLNEIIMDPRTHFDGSVWQLEPGSPMPPDTRGRPVKQWDRYSLYFGGVHALMDHAGTIEAMGDPRRDGVGRVL